LSRFVVDANVAIKWFVPEVRSAAASALLQPGNQMIAPDLLFPECGNVLWKKARTRDITIEQGIEIAQALSVMPIDLYSTKPLLESAVQLAFMTGCSVYDAMYVALAISQNCKLKTADQRLLDKFASTPIDHHIELI
jgi:predicted nucleic acid-binding protein